MTLLLALIYFIAGVICIQRPGNIVQWIGNALTRTGSTNLPEWLKGRGIILVIRIIGFLALINAVTLFYTATYRH